MADATETSPLLEPQAEGSNEVINPNVSETNTSTPAGEYFKRPIKTITTVILIAGIVNLFLIIGTDLVANFGQFSSVRHLTTDGLLILGVFIFLSLIVAGLNLNYPVHIILNIVFDVLLAYAIILSASSLITYDRWPDYGWCDSGYYHENPIPEHCDRWKVALQVLVGIVAGFGEVVGIAQLVLFVLRVVAVFRTKFWQRPWGLYFPTGEVTVAFTIKVLKQQPPAESQAPAGPGVEVTVA